MVSNAKYEGTWANGLQDGYGSETYADGGQYWIVIIVFPNLNVHLGLRWTSPIFLEGAFGGMAI